MPIANQVLPIALGVVMLSLGLALTLEDFRRVMKVPRAVAIALLCQTVLLPLICFGLVIALHLPAELAVGMMLLAASPGGTIANVMSHLANGDVALNITLTAVNSLLSVITLPLILWLSLSYFMDEGRMIPLQFSKIVQVFAIVLVPVAIGMLLRWRKPGIADRLDKPLKIFAAVFLFFAAAAAINAAWPTMEKYFAVLGFTVIVFNIISLLVGYGLPKLARLDHRQAIAISMEIGMHNGALAIGIALSPQIFNSPVIAAGPSLYAVMSLFVTSAFAWLVNRMHRRGQA